MTTLALLVAIWALAFWLSATFNGALILGTMISAAAAGMSSSSVGPKGSLVATIAVMLGAALSRTGLAPRLIPAVSWLLLALIIWQNRPHHKAGDGARGATPRRGPAS